MNLGKLLSASTSFFGGGEKAAYRLNKGGALPKFNVGRNPFGHKSAEAEESGAQAAAVPAVPAPAPAQKSPPPYAFKPAGRPADGQTAQPAAQPVARTEAKPARHGWTTRLNPFRAPEPAPARPPLAVQTELSLNSVKVVHNDLADADVEVVPVKSRTDGQVEAPILPPARRAWEYLGESLMKS
jgi:hypothetical protein